MKFREDFVTNSSSSSFILAFSNKSKIAEELADEKYLSPWRRDRLLQQCLDHSFNSLEECLDTYRNELYETVKLQVEHDLEYEMGFPAMIDWRDSNPEEFGKLIENTLIDEVNTLKHSIEKLNFFSMITISDHDDPDMEHDIMPLLRCTKARINNH